MPFWDNNNISYRHTSWWTVTYEPCFNARPHSNRVENPIDCSSPNDFGVALEISLTNNANVDKINNKLAESYSTLHAHWTFRNVNAYNGSQIYHFFFQINIYRLIRLKLKK